MQPTAGCHLPPLKELQTTYRNPLPVFGALLPLLCIVSLAGVLAGQNINTIAGGGVAGGPAKSVFIAYPGEVVRDTQGNTYISSNGDHYIYKLDTTGNVSVFAGVGYAGFSGDGGPATQATLYIPGGMAFDKAGNLYVGDAGNNRIRRVDKTGTITTVAGSGTPNMFFQGGYGGDNGPATEALLNSAYDVSIDTNGNLLIADYKNFRIREVNLKTGIITTVAGNGSAGYSGDNGPATEAELNFALCVLADNSGGFYIADSGNNVIRHVDGKTQTIVTVAGNGTGGFSGDGGPATAAELSFPNAVVQDALGNLYIIDTGNNRVRRVFAKDQIMGTVVGNGVQGFGGDGGLATAAEISDTSGAYVDNKAEQLLLADSGNQRVRVISGKTGIIGTLAGGGTAGEGGPATAALLGYPVALALDSAGGVLIAERNPPLVRRISSGGKITTVAGSGSEGFSGDGGPATAADFFCVSGVAVDHFGNLFISDCEGRVRRVDHATHTISTFAGNGTFCSAAPCGDGGPATLASVSFPATLATDKAGNLYIADVSDMVVRRVSAATGVIEAVAGDYAPCSSPPTCGDGSPATMASLTSPYGVAVDSAGNLLIADTRDNQIRRVDVTTGIISTVAFNSGALGFSGDGGPATLATMSEPLNVAVDALGNIFVAGGVDTFISLGGGYEVVRRVDAKTGLITTVAGQDTNPSSYGFSGDGGPATAALLNNLGIAVDNDGGFYIADGGNNRVRKVGP